MNDGSVPHPSTPARERTAHVQATVDDLVDRVRALTGRRSGRTMLGLVGAPGAGKSTLASALESRLADLGAVVVPFDGFHLAEVTLARLGRRHRKGAIDTFDLDGYAHLLHRLRAADSVVYAPHYDRSIEEPVAGAVTVPAECRLVITEGNYLLADHPAARRAREALDAVWFLELDEQTRTERLVRRHIQFGKAPAAAADWVRGTDQVNANLVAGTRDDADLVVRLVDGAPPDG